ncbi:LysM peptidoglycan-binding domain-containing protein [Neobacillus sp. DY30]|uniref:peptidoglycan recognition protein family protein n=1 Tax=Neobacillus sp. DY30 TaxID=3047871 RepID=UPI0024BFDF57|nr:LysM peptidoglycan-binding domain-containing protein [Neobacillus sp. DY30]WHY03130.1 LysM peptidoglycan-binding domain-containing protein [Neobacillus sp. DY30]
MKKPFVISFCLIFLLLMYTSPVLATNNPRNIYEVKSGDYLWKIATTYGTSVEDLKLINGLQSDLLIVGQKLRVPIMYEVVSGDTLWKLSQTFNSTVQLIKTANGLTSDAIYVGQKIKIPPKKLNMQGQFILMNREEFKDWIFNQKFIRKVGKIQQHHTYQPSYQAFNGSNHFALLNGMKDYHVNGMKWSDISQQLTTFPDGTVAVGRPFNTPPEGSFGLLNKSVMHAIEADALAIENVGNFDAEHMTAEQKETIITVTALLMLKYGLTPSIDSITYHHWWDINSGERVLDNGHGHAIKTCPGTGFFGGNSTADAKNNFYPLVTKKMQEILMTIK